MAKPLGQPYNFKSRIKETKNTRLEINIIENAESTLLYVTYIDSKK